VIRAATSADFETIYTIINDAAQKYKGVIPADCWHEPYMSRAELAREIAAGVNFYGVEEDGVLVAVMGIQHVQDVTLIRHAYTRPAFLGRGYGSALLAHLRGLTTRPILIGTWADAIWAIRFYEQRGFYVVPREEKEMLLRRYWTVPDRQIKTSVVLREA
jgi:GNAT superfamily N-acetyltransferase